VIPKLKSALKSLGIDVIRETERGALAIHRERDVYLPTGGFEPKAMIEMLQRSIDESRKNGFEGFRSAGELGWAAAGRCSCDQLLGYEKLVEAAYPRQAAIGVCQYAIQRFPKETLKTVLEAHRLCLSVATKNMSECKAYIQKGTYTAEIMTHRGHPASGSYYVVQKQGERDILAWGSEAVIEGAITSSEAIIADLIALDRKQARHVV